MISEVAWSSTCICLASVDELSLPWRNLGLSIDMPKGLIISMFDSPCVAAEGLSVWPCALSKS